MSGLAGSAPEPLPVPRASCGAALSEAAVAPGPAPMLRDPLDIGLFGPPPGASTSMDLVFTNRGSTDVSFAAELAS